MMHLPRRIVSAILALEFLLSLLQLIDAHSVWFFPMINGQSYSLRFNLSFSLLPVLLPISSLVLIFLIKEGKFREVLIAISVSIGLYLFFGIEAAVAWFSFFQISLMLFYFIEIGDFLFWLMALMTGFEFTALIHWVLLPLGIVSPLAWFADLELALFYIHVPLAPLIFFTIILVVLSKLLAPQYLTTVARFLGLDSFTEVSSKSERIYLQPSILLLASIVISIVGSLYPYNQNLNPSGAAFGVDVPYYIDWMGPVNQDLASAFTVANGSRPVVLWLMYGVQNLFELKLIDAIKYLPVLLNPLLALSVFFMVSEATEDQEWAGLASLFTALGFKITVGMYSYFLANMLGLILVYSSLGFFFKTLRARCNFSLTLASVLGSMVVFSHPWTFTQYYAATVLFLGYTFFKGKRSGELSLVLIYLGVTGTVAIFKETVFGGLSTYGSGVLITSWFFNMSRFWSNNIFIFRLKYGGFLSSTVILGLVVLGVYLLDTRKPFQLYLLSLLAALSPYYLVANEEVMSRLVYNVPFGVLSASGILFLLRNNDIKKRVRMTFLVFTLTYLLAYFLRSLANIL
jgi:hypothetical protein